MLDIPLIRNAIVSGLYAKLGRPVIPADDDGDVPEYPFVTYSITSPYLDLYGHDVEVLTENAEGLIIERSKTIEQVFSFTAYSEDLDEASELCMRIIEHFNREARDSLRDAGIVVVSASDIQNRSVLLVEHYERRMGVDVRFRVVDQSVNTETYIEQAEIKERE